MFHKAIVIQRWMLWIEAVVIVFREEFVMRHSVKVLKTLQSKIPTLESRLATWLWLYRLASAADPGGVLGV